MRLDLFLKKTALVRQRGLAKELCVAGAVSVDGHAAKASHVVRAGERVAIQLPGRRLEVRVLEVPHGNVARRDAAGYIEVLHDERVDRLTHVLEAEPETHGDTKSDDAERDTHADARRRRLEGE